MTEKEHKEIMYTLFTNANSLSFGTVAVELKIHAGKCTQVVFTTSINIRQKEVLKDDKKDAV